MSFLFPFTAMLTASDDFVNDGFVPILFRDIFRALLRSVSPSNLATKHSHCETLRNSYNVITDTSVDVRKLDGLMYVTRNDGL